MGDLGRGSVIKTCPVCGKQFIPSVHWMYKLRKQYYCRYSCYSSAGGDSHGYKSRFYVRENATNRKR